ncbi:class I SAM-dependent methyltransferase [Sulfolobus acidocaldarius]|uniref:Class I SAM-dependent methyltransferase n=4 Tax=Sulfolobus acidocaldarius TaxID=2285 RepID=Q4J9M5_SULAC|nr:class I SAM-dependent methyltransferase [Sulfolobus acidocaldarius]AAY80505.1 hypothetical protein Saci_1158 [Sulfolobus acidocaldarius DSM 639]AGE71094.1 hypothetical protein SacN8_05645 [Sulfolobus acidocaldarius N8]AGE73365.1 hypothetical protein SacRon12I_05635 [Sulfolobus acidocaldarius Ron12/I]ALU28630.1 hypothetical protein ATY89_00705 [Sulfolobus acidocaldarius]ALU31345.1 hypothetical protein ATZ20_03745 [Sulfolobus acidocaldarius]
MDLLRIKTDTYIKEYSDIEKYIEQSLGGKFPYALSKTKRIILYAIIKETTPKIAIETGVGPGVSSTIILSALPEDSVLYSIDVRNRLEDGNEVGYIIPQKLRKKWKFFLGESRRFLPKILQEVNEVNFFLHDSDHSYENVMFELSTIWYKLSEGGVILVDNYRFSNATIDFVSSKKAIYSELSDEAGGLLLILKP